MPASLNGLPPGPLAEALDDLIRQNKARFHMPGHKGHMSGVLSEASVYDFTEIPGADDLYSPTGPILEMEKRFACCYSSGASLLSAGGSTLCIQTMLFFARRLGRGIICSRNIHRSAVAAMGLLGMEPYWVCGNIATSATGLDGIALPVTPEQIEEAIAQNPYASSVYITSPDYYGQMADIGSISEVCHRNGKLLLVDNAHGAHLITFKGALHPMRLGADMCCDSLHKTLPALTGCSMLHLRDERLYSDAKYAMSLFGSSSPSYLIMLSADKALGYLEERTDDYLKLASWISRLKALAFKRGLDIIDTMLCDPVKLSLGLPSAGFSRESFGAYLDRCGLTPEYMDNSVCVFMPTPFNTDEEFDRLWNAIDRLAPIGCRSSSCSVYSLPRQRLSISEAMNRPHIILPPEKSLGRTAARLVSICPPGTPILVPGEEINEESLSLIKSAGIDMVYVVK